MIDMTKLRTLIQMEVPINDLNCDEYSTDLVATSEELRDEAIKWIKNEALLGDKNHISPEVKHWIKHFFNITEKDLNGL